MGVVRQEDLRCPIYMDYVLKHDILFQMIGLPVAYQRIMGRVEHRIEQLTVPADTYACVPLNIERMIIPCWSIMV